MHPEPPHHPAESAFPEPPWARPEQAQAEGELRAIEAQVAATRAEVEAAAQVLGELQRRLQALEAQEVDARTRAAHVVEHGVASSDMPSTAPGGIDRRRHGRVKVTDVLCSMGKVLDVSASGCKVETKGKPPFSPGEVFSMWISSTAAGSFTLSARIVWVKKVSMFKHLCGVCFEELDAEARTGLMTIVATAAGREIGWES
ncbi:MAG: PilZ domain-containing protein [Phycisphaerales bacterium]|nr:PilZ domain-containing protein [Phycisphaerales bacterium]